jgi:hypothetical protein
MRIGAGAAVPFPETIRRDGPGLVSRDDEEVWGLWPFAIRCGYS